MTSISHNPGKPAPGCHTLVGFMQQVMMEMTVVKTETIKLQSDHHQL